MELEITPEPSPEEREALEQALARLLAEPGDPRSAWWREGVSENLSDSEGEPA
jgi:hypothetical protein